jgi:carbon monoxide dehydrogenase subunit G
VIIDQKVTIAAPTERVWDFMMDVPAVSQCLPGVESVSRVDQDTYAGTLNVRVGPIAVRLEGNVIVREQDAGGRTARMELKAADKRVNGAVNAKMQMQLHPRDDGQTDLAIHTDAAVLGKLGEFGQAVIRKKADQMIAEFARNLSAQVTAPR